MYDYQGKLAFVLCPLTRRLVARRPFVKSVHGEHKVSRNVIVQCESK